MEILTNAPQGSEAWHTARATRFCASEAAAAMGVSKYTTRSALLKQKATGLTEEVTPAKQRLFDAGHQSEADAGPIAERIAGVEFYPAVGITDFEGLPLLASFDGIDMMEEVLWENKLLNAGLADQVRAGELVPHYWAQLEHQLLVSGASKALFTTSDGTEAGTHSMWYESMPERRAQLIAAWKQFQADLASYVPAEIVAPIVATSLESLPALTVRMQGELAVISNLPELSVALRSFIGRIPAKASTDQEFADTDSACKALKKFEEASDAAEESALAQLSNVEEFRRLMADLRGLARTTRLQKEKDVAARKEQIRVEIVQAGQQALAEHVAGLNQRIGKAYLPVILADFGAAIKGKRTVDSLRDAVNTTLANAKISASAIADKIQINMATLRELAHAHIFLFSDAGQLVQKAPDDLRAVVVSRIAEHDKAEAARLERERETIRQQEREKLEREQAAAAKRQQDEADAQARAAAQAAITQAATPAPAPAPAPAAAVTPLQTSPITAPVAVTAPTAALTDDAATVNISQINAILASAGVSTSAGGLALLGFEALPAKGAAKLYREADLPRMVDAMREHLAHALETQAA